MTKINPSQICKIFNCFCFIKEFVRDDQLIMKCMIKGVLFCYEAFCSKFLIRYGRPLSNTVCH